MSGIGTSVVEKRPKPSRERTPGTEKGSTDSRASHCISAGEPVLRVVLYVKGFPPRETGGPVEVAAQIALGLLDRGNVCLTLVVQTDSSEQEIRDVLGHEENLAVLRLPYFPAMREVLALGPVIRALASADIIHFNEFPFRHLPLIVLAKARGVPVVFSMHGLLSHEIGTFLGPSYPLTLEEGGGSFQVRMPPAAIGAFLSLYRWFSRAWAAVVVPSEALKNDATSLERFPPARIAVIPHGVKEPDAPATLPAEHDGPLRILFVGKLEPVKGPDLLIEAVGHLRADGIPVDVSIVGAGSMESDLRARAGVLGLPHVAFLGLRRGDDLAALYAACDLVVVPSRRESLSLVVLEAMAAGRPILATNVGGIPETAREPRNAILVRPDSIALGDGLRRLIEQPELRAAMAKANLSDVRRRSWSSVVDRYARLYATLLSGSGVSSDLRA